MGAMLTAIQQARRPGAGAALRLCWALFGFSNARRAHISVNAREQELGYAGDPTRSAAPTWCGWRGLRSSDPYLQVKRTAQGTELFAGATADARGVEALKPARLQSLLLTAGVFSMVPGSSSPESAAITVPVLLALGDRDMAGPPHLIPANYPASPDVTLVVLPATGHAHFVFPSRLQLFERMAGWCEAILPEA